MASRITTIDVEQVSAKIAVRKISEAGIDRLVASIKEKGYIERYPVAVSPDGAGNYKLLDGNHRIEALRRLGISRVPAQVFDDLTTEDEYRIAFQSNEGLGTLVPQDWTDHAEFVWRLAEMGKTQQEIAGILGWSRERVKDYAALNRVCEEAWRVVVGATKGEIAPDLYEGVAPEDGAVAPRIFTENLLRSIIHLTAEQQLELVKGLAKTGSDELNKAKEKFKKRAEVYRAENELAAEAERLLKDLPEEYLDRARKEIQEKVYINEWLDGKVPGEQFLKLIQSVRDEHAQKQNYRLFCIDVVDLGQKVEVESVDVIITDPPYSEEYLPLYEKLAILAQGTLKEGGSLLVMTGQSYIPQILNLMTPHMNYHWMVSYLTPGGQATQLWQRKVNTFWKPVLWFVKGEYTGKWLGDVAKSAINDNDKRYHEWGQSESGMRDIIERFSNRGDVILDPFLGGGTTGVVAVALGRQFIGSDIDQGKVEEARSRIEGVGEIDEHT